MHTHKHTHAHPPRSQKGLGGGCGKGERPLTISVHPGAQFYPSLANPRRGFGARGWQRCGEVAGAGSRGPERRGLRRGGAQRGCFGTSETPD